MSSGRTSAVSPSSGYSRAAARLLLQSRTPRFSSIPSSSPEPLLKTWADRCCSPSRLPASSWSLSVLYGADCRWRPAWSTAALVLALKGSCRTNVHPRGTGTAGSALARWRCSPAKFRSPGRRGRLTSPSLPVTGQATGAPFRAAPLARSCTLQSSRRKPHSRTSCWLIL